MATHHAVLGMAAALIIVVIGMGLYRHFHNPGMSIQSRQSRQQRKDRFGRLTYVDDVTKAANEQFEQDFEEYSNAQSLLGAPLLGASEWIGPVSCPMHGAPNVAIVLGGETDPGTPETGLIGAQHWSRVLKAPIGNMKFAKIGTSTATGRFQGGAAVIGNKLYVAGGQDYTGAQLGLEVYDPLRNEWSTITDTQYDSKRNKWSTVNDPKMMSSSVMMPFPRSEFATAVVDCEMYLIGGSTYDIGMMTDVYCFAPATNQWRMIAPVSGSEYQSVDRGGKADWYPTWVEGVVGAAAAAVGKKIYLFGGAFFERRIMCYDTERPERKWVCLPSMPNTWNGEGWGYRHTAITYEGKIYVMGGRDTANYGMATCRMYNPDDGSIIKLPDMPRDRAGHVALEANGKIYLIGGYGQKVMGRNMDMDDINLDTIDVYDIGKQEWNTMNTRLDMPRWGLVGGVLRT